MKPILFNTEMVKAILDDRKTNTRRVVKPQPKGTVIHGICTSSTQSKDVGKYGFGTTEQRVDEFVNPPYKVGDVLYVRETWKVSSALVGHDSSCEVEYRAGGSKKFNRIISIPSVKWHPSLHMPKSAARIFLKITGVRVERLQDITAEQCADEGIDIEGMDYGFEAVHEFSQLWDSTIKKTDLDQYSWDANPFVWVIEFERCDLPYDGRDYHRDCERTGC